MNRLFASLFPSLSSSTTCRFTQLLSGFLVSGLLLAHSAFADTTNTHVRMQTNMGSVLIELDSERAPLTVKNFLQLVTTGFYNGTIFHRVVAGFIVQGGGYDPKLKAKATKDNLFNESGNGLTNRLGTIAMARTNDPHSANSEFYFNLADNNNLDPQPARWGYAVFGKVLEGMEVIQAIGEVETVAAGDLDEVPNKPIIIEKMEVVK